MSDLTYDLGDLSAGSQAITALASTASLAAQALAETANDAAMSWGTDAPGQAFAGVYLDPATEALSSALTVGHQLNSIASNIAQMRTLYEQNEETGVALAEDVGP